MKYILRRIAAVIPVMAVVAVVVFMLIHLSDGDPAAVIAGDNATAEDVEKIRQNLGLDKPLLQQFGIWVGNIATGDLGTSIATQMPVSQLIGQRLGPTFSIAAFTMLFAVLLAIPLGVLAAWHAGRWLDRLVMVGSVCAFSVPVFLIGYSLVYGFRSSWAGCRCRATSRPTRAWSSTCATWCCPVCRWAWSTWRCSRA